MGKIQQLEPQLSDTIDLPSLEIAGGQDLHLESFGR